MLSLVATVAIHPVLLTNFKAQPSGYLIPLVVFGSLIALFFYHSKGREKSAFICSCLYLAGMLGGAAFAVYPNVLMASGDPANNLTIANTITGSYGLQIAIRWWTVGMVFAIAYFVVLYRMFRGKLTTEGGDSHGY